MWCRCRPTTTVLSLLKKPTGVAAALVTYVHQSVDKYDASMNQGIKQTETAVAEVLKSCPHAKLILGGYSQGAVAIHDAENALPTAELSHIAGTLLLADPDRVSNTKSKRFGDSLAKGEGIRSTCTWLGRPTSPSRAPQPPSPPSMTWSATSRVPFARELQSRGSDSLLIRDHHHRQKPPGVRRQVGRLEDSQLVSVTALVAAGTPLPAATCAV